jgi:hypothetical protein
MMLPAPLGCQKSAAYATKTSNLIHPQLTTGSRDMQADGSMKIHHHLTFYHACSGATSKELTSELVGSTLFQVGAVAECSTCQLQACTQLAGYRKDQSQRHAQ